MPTHKMLLNAYPTVQCAALRRYTELTMAAPQKWLLDLLKDAMYGNCPLDADEPPTTLGQSAEPSNLISFSSNSGVSSMAGSAGSAANVAMAKRKDVNGVDFDLPKAQFSRQALNTTAMEERIFEV